MKSLIYTTAFGDPVFFHMAQECVTSARRHGYADDFLVLADRDWNFAGAQCRVTPNAANLLLKAALIRVLGPADIAAYDRVLFVDSDCAFRADPGIALRQEGLRFPAVNPGGGGYNTLFFTLHEVARALEQGIAHVNTGTILMPGSAARDLLRDWEAFWRECPRVEACSRPAWAWCNPMMMDQPAMQALLFRRSMPWEGFDPGTVSFPLYSRNESAAIVHYCGPQNGGRNSHLDNKRNILAWMRAANATS